MSTDDAKSEKITSTDNLKEYKPLEIEQYWQSKWEEEKTYQVNIDTASKPFYNLMMFPYPSAEGLHVGNVYTFGGIDAFGRFKRMQGYDVFEPIGLDGFGIHSENYAIKVGRNPHEHARISEENFYRQLHSLGNGFDWSRKLETYDPKYYKWTQWLFTELFKAGLAYKASASVNFCPSCKTVLSDEQVIDGKCERCGTIVEKRDLEQWFFAITNYADRLLANTANLDWTEKVKIAQKNWIGKKTGALVRFKIQDARFKNNEIEVFTTRPDTLFGATFLVVAPEHPIVAELLNSDFSHKGTTFVEGESIQNSKLEEIKKYIIEVQAKSNEERLEEGKEKNGVFSGLYAINPVNNEQIPIWIADYVLMGYGTGAIMAVPAHDQRDYEFSKKYNLPIVDVVMASLIDKGNPPQAGKEETKRNNVLSIVYDSNTDKYLTLKWKQQNWYSFITGGIEEGEDVIEAAKREISEETGYTDLELVRKLGGPVEAFFYAAHKGVNRQSKTHLLLYKLKSDKRVAIDLREQDKYETLWLNKDEIEKLPFRHAEMDLIWQRIENDSAYIGEGVLNNSGEWNGWHTPEAIEHAIKWLEEKNFGKKSVNYHLRDWLISRQRYWGPPIPMIYCEHCAAEGKSWFDTEEAIEYRQRLWNPEKELPGGGQNGNSKLSASSAGMENRNSAEWNSAGWYPVPVTQLPVLLPDVPDVKPLGTGKSPLANYPEFYETRCPVCGEKASRETDVSDTFLDSAWYFFRYTSTDIDSSAFDRDRVKKWLPVTSYIGGAEHAVLHLLYSRFITMVLKDLEFINFEEPYSRFRANGLIIKDGAKMSKSKGNVINPDDYVKKYGADTLRTYLAFIGPFNQGGDFQDTGIDGIWRFLNRVWKLVLSIKYQVSSISNESEAFMHKTIKGVTEDMEELRFNTAIAKIMTYYNFLVDQKETISNSVGISREEIEVLLKLLAPFAPHLTEELWNRIHTNNREFPRSDLARISNDSWSSIHKQPWPVYDESKIVSDTVMIAVQINGKLRETLQLQISNVKSQMSNGEQQMVEEKARELPNVKKYLEGKSVKNTIYVPGKILNFVI